MHKQQINEVNNADYFSDDHTYASRTNQFTHCHSSLSASSRISHHLENTNTQNSSNNHSFSSINSDPLRKKPNQGSFSDTLPATDTVQIESTQNTSRKRLAQQNLHNSSPTSQKQNKREKHTILSEQEKKLQERCRKFGVQYEMPAQNETYLKLKNGKQKLNRQIEKKINTYQIKENVIPPPLLFPKTANILIKLWILYEHLNFNKWHILSNFVQFVMRGD